MSQGRQVLHGLTDTLLVVNSDGPEEPWGVSIDYEYGYVAAPENVNERFLSPETQNRDAVHPTPDHLTSRRFQQTWILAYGAQQNLVIVLNAQFRECLDDLGKNGLVISDTISPKVRLRPDTRARAWAFG